jgi:hypothetical protein
MVKCCVRTARQLTTRPRDICNTDARRVHLNQSLVWLRGIGVYFLELKTSSSLNMTRAVVVGVIAWVGQGL